MFAGTKFFVLVSMYLDHTFGLDICSAKSLHFLA